MKEASQRDTRGERLRWTVWMEVGVLEWMVSERIGNSCSQTQDHGKGKVQIYPSSYILLRPIRSESDEMLSCLSSTLESCLVDAPEHEATPLDIAVWRHVT